MFLLLVLALQEPPKIEWYVDPVGALEEAADYRKPVVALFHAQTCKNSKALLAGPLVDARVAAAAWNFVMVKVDVDKETDGWREKYGVRFTPTLLVLDPAGKRVAEIVERDAAPLAERLGRSSDLFGPWCRTVAEALERGQRRKVPVLIHFDADDKAVFAACRERLESFVIVRVPFKADAPEAKRFSVDEDRTWVVVNPLLEKPEAELLGRYLLKAETEAGLKEKIGRLIDAWPKR